MEGACPHEPQLSLHMPVTRSQALFYLASCCGLKLINPQRVCVQTTAALPMAFRDQLTWSLTSSVQIQAVACREPQPEL